MRTATFEPLDLQRLGELTVGVLAAAAAGRQVEVDDLLRRIDVAGGSFAVSWALALAAARADVSRAQARPLKTGSAGTDHERPAQGH